MSRARDVAILTPHRREILAVLGQEHTAGQVAHQFAGRITRTAVSQHLTVLLEAELITFRQDGRRRWYRADRWALRAMVQDAWTEMVP